MHPAGAHGNAPLVDAHVHIRQGNAALDCAARAGVTAVRDAGSKEGVGLTISRGRPNAPALVTAGWALYKKGGYGSLLGAAVETHDEIRSEILKLKNAGAGIIKVVASGLVSLIKPGQVTPGGFSREELSLIEREAGSLGLGVMAHANGEAAILAAAESGVRSVEHGFFMTEHALEVMAKRGIFWTPTVGALARAADTKAISKEMSAHVTALIASHLTMIARAYEFGVSLAVGTDCVLPDSQYEKIYDAELSYFERAGIPRDELIKIACEGGARLLELRRAESQGSRAEREGTEKRAREGEQSLKDSF
jgi:imidazolonepropionase-like amidohydrolase